MGNICKGPHKRQLQRKNILKCQAIRIMKTDYDCRIFAGSRRNEEFYVQDSTAPCPRRLVPIGHVASDMIKK
jgi:hypothetical protein